MNDLIIIYISVFISCSILWCSYCLIDYAKCKRKQVKSNLRIKSYPITILFGILIILILELAIIFIPFPNDTMNCIHFVNESEYIPSGNVFIDYSLIPIILIAIILSIIGLVVLFYPKLKKKRKSNEFNEAI